MRKVNFCNVFFQVLYSETSEKLCRLSTFLVKISSQSGFFTWILEKPRHLTQVVFVLYLIEKKKFKR